EDGPGRRRNRSTGRAGQGTAFHRLFGACHTLQRAGDRPGHDFPRSLRPTDVLAGPSRADPGTAITLTSSRSSPMVFIALACSLGMASAAQGQESEIRVERDIVYGRAGRVELQLNLALPKTGKGPFPAVVCIHGGGWYQGQRQDMDPMTELLARRGDVAPTVSYPLVPTAPLPAQIEDRQTAVRWPPGHAPQTHLNS